MPLTEKEYKILAGYKKQYGAKLGEQYFYASINAGKFGQEAKARHQKRQKK